MTKWLRARFHANFADSRPIIWPPPGPFWETGLSADESYAIVVAYFPSDNLNYKEFWPEAENVSIQEEEEIKFTDRFPKPNWWNDD